MHSTAAVAANGTNANGFPTKSTSTQPLKLSGALDSFETFDVTPCIGTEFKDVDLAQWIKAPDSDALLRDLAILSMTPPYN